MHDPLAQHVADVEHVRLAPGRRGGLRRRRRGLGRRCGQWPGGLVVRAAGRDRDQLAFRIAQRRQPAAEDAAGVQAHGVVDPFGLGQRRVPVQHHRPAPVVIGPRIPNGQAELIRLPRRVAVQGEGADPAGRPAMIRLLQPGVRHHQAAAVQHVVADQPVEEALGLGPEAGLLGLAGLDLAERFGQPVADLDVPAAQRAQQLGLVVAGHRQCLAGRGHRHGQAEHSRCVRAAVNQVTQEDGRASLRVRCPGEPAGRVVFAAVAEPAEQLAELGQAAVHVADHVERPGPVPQVVVHPDPGDDRAVDLFGCLQHPDVPEPLALQAAQRPPQLVVLAAQHPLAELPLRTLRVPLRAHLLRQVEHDGDRQHVMRAGRLDQRLARLGLDVRGVHHGQPAGRQPLSGDVVQHVERVRRGSLVVLVVGDQAAAEVRGEDLGGREVLPGERGLSGSGHAHQRDQGQFRNGDLRCRVAHRSA